MKPFDKLKYTPNIPVRHLPITLTDISVVWLENSQHSPCNDSNVRLNTFYDRCFVVYYSNVAKCIKFLKRTRSRDYVIVVIVAYAIEALRKVLYRLQQYRVAQTILVVSADVDSADHRMSTSDNINFFLDQNTMLDHLELLIDKIQDQSLEGGLFTTFNRRENALKHLRLEFGEFIWAHLFRVMVMSMLDDSVKAKSEMLAECRAYFRSNAVQLAQINEFERTYQTCNAIRWYTKPGFLSYLVNKALRTGDILGLYTFRYFISNLCFCLKQLSATRPPIMIHVYRGAKLNQDEIDRLKVGSLVAANSFFSCSCNRKVAEMFIGVDLRTNTSSNNSRGTSQQNVLFEIDVDTIKCPDVIVADISAQSELPDENEIIFNLGSTFIVNRIHYDAQKSLWFIQMSSTSNVARIHSEYESYISIRLKEINPIILFGYTLALIGSDFTQSLMYFHRLLRTLPMNHDDIPSAYYNLGRVYLFLEKYQKALAYFRCARLLLRRLLPQRIFDYSRVLGGLGTVYSELGKTEIALHLLAKALVFQRKNLPDNHTEIPFHLHRLGHAYFKAQQFKCALSVLLRSDNFFRTRMPIDHHGHAQTLHSLGLVYRALENDENAVSCFKEALRQYESLLAKDHPYVASTLYQLSLIYKDRGEHELALNYARMSLQIRQAKLPHNHSELRQSRELLYQLQKQ